jgi:hypothetical protein
MKLVLDTNVPNVTLPVSTDPLLGEESGSRP